MVLIGEMRDLETIESALRIAETGHLTFATLHTNSACIHHQPHHRRVPVAPAAADPRAALAGAGRHSVPSAAAEDRRRGRAMAMEMLVPNAADPQPDPRRQDPPDLFGDATGQDKSGMQTFNQSLATRISRRRSRWTWRCRVRRMPDELQDMINRGAGLNSGRSRGRSGR